MILTFREFRYNRLNKKMGVLEEKKKKYNDQNDPQHSIRTIIDTRITKLNAKIKVAKNKMDGNNKTSNPRYKGY
ncbi:MAG: hypothetical protein ACI4MB_01515 [Candidatus Coproplasma sp.]